MDWADRLLMYAFSLGNRFYAFAKNDVRVNPPALDFRQRVERVPQTDKELHPLQKFLGRGLMQQAEYSIPSSQSREYCALCRESRR